MGFALSYLGECANILSMCSLTTVSFSGGWFPPIDLPIFNWIPGFIRSSLKTVFILFLFIRVRVAYPRYRYDQLMRSGWKVFLPLSLAFSITTASLPIHSNILPL
jgi:NADH-quinone oxidoreductase subunit H